MLRNFSIDRIVEDLKVSKLKSFVPGLKKK